MPTQLKEGTTLGKKLLLVTLVLALALATLIGCTPAGGNEDPVEKKKVIMVTDSGGVDDKSFNQAAWTGLDSFGDANAEKVVVDYVESNSAEDYAPNLTAAVDQGAGLVWGVGYMMADQLDDAAKNNPDTRFGLIDSAPADEADALANVAYVVFNENEGSFLVGLIAGLTTETNNVGFVGGMSGGVIEKFEAGFHAGVKAANPEATVQVQYAEDWGDLAKGEQIATTMINNGADIIYHAAGGTGIGVAQACDKAQVHFIGVDVDQSDLTPYTLTSMLKRLDTAITTISGDWLNDKFEGGKVYTLGLAEDGVGYVYDAEKISDEVKAVVDDFSAKIKSGELVVPGSNADITAFLDSLKTE